MILNLVQFSSMGERLQIGYKLRTWIILEKTRLIKVFSSPCGIWTKTIKRLLRLAFQEVQIVKHCILHVPTFK